MNKNKKITTLILNETNSLSSYYEKILATGEVKCIDDEIPFEIPVGWSWSRLGSLSFDSADGPFGSNLKREHYTSNREVRIIQLSNIGEFGWKDSNVRYTTYTHLANISRSEAFAGDIIIAKMMPAGRAIICPTLESKYVLSSDAVRFSFSTELVKPYLYYAINSPVFLEQVYGQVQGITRVRTSLQKLRSYLLPIPPTAEQEKIVEIIDQLLTLTFNYDKAQSDVNELNKNLKPLLKKSILQEAIQGHLIAQCSSDEPASKLLEKIQVEKARLVKEGKLKKSVLADSVIFKGDDNKYFEKRGKEIKCIDDEIPFEIPESWQWIRGRFGFIPMESSKPDGNSFIYIDVAAVNNKNNQIEGAKELCSKDAPSRATRKLHLNDILFSMVRPYLRNIAIVTEDYSNAIASTGYYVITPSCGFYPEYLFFLMLSPYVVDGLNQFMKGDNSPSINNADIENFLYPLPPFNEQRRIVERINSLRQVL